GQRYHTRAVNFRRIGRIARNGRELGKPAQRLRGSCHEIAPQGQDFTGLRFRIGRGAEHHGRLDRMQSKLEADYDSESATAATDCPEEVGVSRLARPQLLAVSGHDIDRYEIVDAQAMAPAKPANSA